MSTPASLTAPARRLAGTSLHAPLERIDLAIGAMEARPWASRELDAQLYRALGWEVEYLKAPRGGWRCRSPLQTDWQMLATPTRSTQCAARIVPHGWSYGAGLRARLPFAWVAGAWPIAEGVPVFECGGATAALALAKAGLFARRWCALRALGAA